MPSNSSAISEEINYLEAINFCTPVPPPLYFTTENGTQGNSSTRDASTVEIALPDFLVWVSTPVIVLVFLVGVIGNLLVPIVVLKGKRSTPVYFMTNLAVSDLSVLLLCLPTVLVELHSTPESWVLGYALCKSSSNMNLYFSFWDPTSFQNELIIEGRIIETSYKLKGRIVETSYKLKVIHWNSFAFRLIECIG